MKTNKQSYSFDKFSICVSLFFAAFAPSVHCLSFFKKLEYYVAVLKMCSRKHRFKESCSSVFHGKHTINETGNEKRQKSCRIPRSQTSLNGLFILLKSKPQLRIAILAPPTKYDVKLDFIPKVQFNCFEFIRRG